MAVAVKNNPTVGGSPLLERLPILSVAGAAYVLASLAAVFSGVRALWYQVLQIPADSFSGNILLVAVMIAAAVFLLIVGRRLLGSQPIAGAKTGIFVTSLVLFVIGLFTRWVGVQLDQSETFGGSMRTLGMVLTIGVGVVLVAVYLRLFARPGFEKWLVTVEEHGWFTAAPYKKTQGLRLRRVTIFGVLVLIGCGVYSLFSPTSLGGSSDWQVGIPFTPASIVVRDPGDSGFKAGDIVGREDFQGAVASLQTTFVRVQQPGDSDYRVGTVVAKEEFDKTVEDLKSRDKEWPTTIEPITPKAGETTYAAQLMLLPDVKFTLPLLVLAVSLWFAWRLVNHTTFADFLIATEAEMNKVSWTSRKRLVQDTIVVLVTVVLFTVFLLGVDVVWSRLLSFVRVINVNQGATTTEVEGEQQPW